MNLVNVFCPGKSIVNSSFTNFCTLGNKLLGADSLRTYVHSISIGQHWTYTSTVLRMFDGHLSCKINLKGLWNMKTSF